MSNPPEKDLLRKPAKIRRSVPQPLGERKGASGLERWLKACVATMLEWRSQRAFTGAIDRAAERVNETAAPVHEKSPYTIRDPWRPGHCLSKG
jgi:hypothetical protein